MLANQNAVRAMFRRRGPTSYSILTKAAHPNKEMKNKDFVKVVFSLAKKTPIEVAEEDFDLLHVLESRATDIDASLKTYIDVSSLRLRWRPTECDFPQDIDDILKTSEDYIVSVVP